MKGEYRHSVDAKGRMAMPAKLREELGEHFVVTKSATDPCITVYSEAQWKKVEEKLALMPQNKIRVLKRFLFSAASDVEPDAQGRILLPQLLREHAHLQKDATVIGCSNYAEIWDSETWAHYGEEKFNIADMDAIMNDLDI